MTTTKKRKKLTGEQRVQRAAVRAAQAEFRKWLESLPREVAADLQELFMLHAAAETPQEKTDISDTLNEILMPQSLLVKIEEQFALNYEDAAVRDRLIRYRRNVGSQIKKRRESLGMSQDALAELASIPQSHVSRLERGKHVPTHLTIKRVSNALGVCPSQLDPGFDSNAVE